MPLAKKRLLIVEDEYLVAMDLAEAIEALGAVVACIAGDLKTAMAVAETDIDGALVDVQLGADKSFPLIDKLSAAGIPIILMTGYDFGVLPDRLRIHPRIAKPFSEAELRQVTLQVLLEA
ncbi:response regulator [Novosphingobium malaysiense]|uniref:Response regulatory domain-containing protein n=1 Tax=Novosphingobium malaysiense TaxID=1348853 RepID=A0A0B1ZDA5_9SPHN|nr:response regulator [Novosphingobium malaysiense]KHK89024.1 hypothetical protein LK12_22645 [Novosphingobium malaysiense]